MTAGDWTTRLHAALRGPFERVVVVDETASTQDAARRTDAGPGTVLVARRQTAGRGRFGRAWTDTGDEGIAASFVVTRRPRPEAMAIAAAVAAAVAAESALGRPVGIKWPNDVVADGRKLAGVLVEQWDDRAVIGIGMNVRQTAWPPALAGRAVSLVELGAECTRLDVLAGLIRAVGVTLPAAADRLREQFARRDVLSATHAAFRSSGRTITGTVVRVDPMHGLLVRTGREHVYLDAATTTVLP